jgi:hypothetical protein
VLGFDANVAVASSPKTLGFDARVAVESNPKMSAMESCGIVSGCEIAAGCASRVPELASEVLVLLYVF